ncbi:hypothetical protein [Sphingopyxis macrogoltabida]|uniref:Tetratricopeptide repeat protein n=1 Tax=Sphingopyxis macrogoltabida TaxID=33050 RepID=A0AAC8YYR7_SPHMC|nr:hypothetical protein [Sphingopyxis macrogoltabida]ALJ13808.1 hypothetical protein LH19_13105 [Sphingopyxis macrogoltabida]AMU88753.1 hypothetical protein ATM17_06810 [Sphingopyxis macrogoltabida]
MVDARAALAAVCLCLAAPAGAEVLTIAAAEPANAEANDLYRLAVERFEGRDGAVFAQALEAELGTAEFDGRPYFRIVAPESGAPIDALVTGTVRSNVEELPVTEKRDRCTEYDPADKKKCLKEVEVEIRCRRRIATAATTVRLVAIADGSVRYSRPLNARDEITYCPDRSASRTVEQFVNATRKKQVETIRDDLAPRRYVLDVRVDENRKGLAKPAAEAFKDAIRQTKSDQAGACAAWTALTRDAVPTAALAFNLGLCSEMQGDFDAATDWYGEAQRQGLRGEAIPAALTRIERHRQAIADWQVRKQLMSYK